MYKKNNGSTEQEILQNQFSAYVKKAVHNRRIQFLTEKSRKFRFETPLFDLDYLLFDTTDIIQEITDQTYRTKCVDRNRLQPLNFKGWGRFNLF